MELGLQGKSAIVTGAASQGGIGNAIARALAAEGARLMLTDIQSEGVEELARHLREDNCEAISMAGDQSDLRDVQAVVAAVHQEFGGVDILVNAAAITNNLGSVSRMEPDKWRREIDVSLTGPYFWIRETVPLMKASNWGRIVNISSTNSIFGQPGVPAYVTAKGGLNALTKQVAREVARNGITCNALVLGPIATEIYKRGVFDENAVNRMTAQIPMGRMGAPDEVGSIAAFLCSRHAAFVSGALIKVDGAMSLSV